MAVTATSTETMRNEETKRLLETVEVHRGETDSTRKGPCLRQGGNLIKLIVLFQAVGMTCLSDLISALEVRDPFLSKFVPCCRFQSYEKCSNEIV